MSQPCIINPPWDCRASPWGRGRRGRRRAPPSSWWSRRRWGRTAWTSTAAARTLSHEAGSTGRPACPETWQTKRVLPNHRMMTEYTDLIRIYWLDTKSNKGSKEWLDPCALFNFNLRCTRVILWCAKSMIESDVARTDFFDVSLANAHQTRVPARKTHFCSKVEKTSVFLFCCPLSPSLPSSCEFSIARRAQYCGNVS